MNVLHDLKSLATKYVEAEGSKDYAAIEAMVTPDVAFKGPFTNLSGSGEHVAALQRMAPVWQRNEMRNVFAHGDQACAVYDFVTTTSQKIPCVEVLTFRDDKICDIVLFFDQAAFAK